MKLIHYSKSDNITLRSRRQDRGRSGCYKPNGLWVSDEDTDWGWSHWCEAEDWGIGVNAFEVTLAPDANMLILNTPELLLEFDREYAFAPYPDIERHTQIEWPRVARKYQGIIISPYHFLQRFDTHWYYGWDCASGCVWNKKAIERICAVD